MTQTVLGLKIDVDTERGTRIGVPNLMQLFAQLGVKATFLFALGPDNTGHALKRIFRPGFFAKVSRTNVVDIYGVKTLLNGILWPGPHIARRHKGIMRAVCGAGHEVGVHCYDHIAWQDNLFKMTAAQVRRQVNMAVKTFTDVFGFGPKTMGSAGWQANTHSLAAYDDQNLLYASDARGTQPFFPQVDHKAFKTLQLPTTLPTLDELLGRPEYPFEGLVDHYLSLIKPGQLNVFTLHAELEGMKYLGWFEAFLKACLAKGIQLSPLEPMAVELLKNKESIPTLPLLQGHVDGRSGTLAVHG